MKISRYTYICVCCFFILVLSCKNKNTQPSAPHPSTDHTHAHHTHEEISQNMPTEEADISAAPIESSFIAPVGWVELTGQTPGFVPDIRYATENNFVNTIMYDCGKCFLRQETADALLLVAEELSEQELGIKLFDCYRPAPVQQKLWDKVPNASYVTPPWKGSQHNRGVAVDLTIVDRHGEQLDMGTAFDFFGEEAHHTYTGHSEQVHQNRLLLKNLMEKHGFSSIRTEWWHYSIKKLQSLDVSEWEWDCE